eukprot:TRINITY_DN498_c0_g1_i1.p1 TRINITY_DN498_c0_g1~~TRINITY_DN498_c0_g1_i1.p1  ORF type:complete len:118 (+),score=25.03 TRINITY_DN498_c0_g1_i1:44-397(+)
MLQPKVLPKVLEQANTDGVKATILLNRQGQQLASSGEDAKVVPAIFANIWNSFDKNNKLEYMLTECEGGSVIITKVTEKLLLCLYGDKKVQLGMLKAKAKVLKDYIEEPLSHLVDVT